MSGPYQTKGLPNCCQMKIQLAHNKLVTHRFGGPQVTWSSLCTEGSLQLCTAYIVPWNSVRAAFNWYFLVYR